MLTVLSNQGGATAWSSWDAPPPAAAVRIRRPQLVGAMWTLFGTSADAVLQPGSAARVVLNDPSKVIVDVLYKALAPPTVVSDHPGANRKDSIKLAIDDGAWIWSAAGAAPRPVTAAEYNPVNTINQQNGLQCALPASSAVASAPEDPGGVYAVPRTACPHRRVVLGQQPKCGLNDRDCGGSGDDESGGRTVTKPRLLAPPVAWLGRPARAARDRAGACRPGPPQRSQALPRAQDLSLLAAWCHSDGHGHLDHSRLMALLGQDGVQMLTSPT